MTRQERRYRATRKIEQRKRLASQLGLKQGTLFEKHRLKLLISYGYMRKGNISHYVATHYRKPYLSTHDMRQLLRWEDKTTNED